MRILYFLAHPNSIGGAAKVLLNQAIIMQRMGHTVKVVLQDDSHGNHIDTYDILCGESSIEYISLIYPISTSIEGIDILACFDSFSKIQQVVLEFKPDILHSVQLNITVEMVARKYGIPHVMNIYPVQEVSFEYNWLNVFPQYHSCDSMYFCKKWEQGLGIVSTCIRVPYDLVRKQEIYSNSKSGYSFICIATFSEYKNQLEIIKFVELCKRRGMNVSLQLVGNDSGQYADKCREYVAKHRLNDNVHFTGEVVHVEDYLQDADALIHISRVESYPGVIVEAMANMIPVIVAPAGGIGELVHNKYNGFIVDGFCADDLYRAFGEFAKYKNSGRIKSIQDNALKTYYDNHSVDSVGRQLMSLYSTMLEKGCNPKNRELHGVEYFKYLFKKFIDENDGYINSKYMRSRVWMLYYLAKKISPEKNALIWGTGVRSKDALEVCALFKLNIMGFIDTYKKGEHYNYAIFQPQNEIVYSADYIIVSATGVNACGEIISFLESLDLKRNRDFFLMENDPCLC